MNKTLLKGIAGIFWFGKKSYSQFGEDLAIEKLFSAKEKGFYIDIGSFHPKVASNTYKLYKKGWSGINIDAEKRKINLFNLARKRDINIATLISESDLEYLEFIVSEDGSYGSMNKIYIPNDKTLDFKKYRIEKIPNTNINSILSKYCKTNHIDFLNIDIEGFDFNILKQIDLSIYFIKVICLETNISDMEKFLQSEVYQYLKINNYSISWFGFPSAIFTKNN